MKTERELFEEWYKSEYPLDYEHYVNEQDIGLFTKLYLRCFASWQASAQREGYKLVPVELVDEIEDKIWDNLSANHTITNQEGDGFIPVEDIDLGGIYKAMIGAAP